MLTILLDRFNIIVNDKVIIVEGLKFAKLQYVSSGFRCRVITGSLMRLY